MAPFLNRKMVQFFGLRSVPKGTVHCVTPFSRDSLRLAGLFPENSDSTHSQRPKWKNTDIPLLTSKTTLEEGYDTLPLTDGKRRLSMSRKEKAPAKNKHIPKAVGMATSRTLATEYETVVSEANFTPTANPPPPIAQAAARRNGKPRISLHPTGPNLLCNFTIM